MTIAITGATGHLGRLVLAELATRAPGADVVALVRNPDKATDLGVPTRQADYDEPSGWGAALAGVDTLLLISASEVGRRVPQHQTVIAAAKEAGVRRIAYTSILRADTSPLGLANEHRQTEKALADSGLTTTLLRNGWYTENYTAAIHGALAAGAVAGCAEDGKLSLATRADFAAAAAVVVTTEGHEGKVYELAGDVGYTLADFAAELSRQTGKQIPYANMPQAEYAKLLASVGLPQGFADLLADSEAAAAKGALFDDGHQLSKLIGRATTPLADAIAAALSAG